MLLISVPATAEISNMNEAINTAGMQRMLTQRIVKAYALQGINVQADVAKTQLEEAITQFEGQLGDLKKFASEKAIRQALDEVETLWIPFKAIATSQVTKNNAKMLLQRNDELLAAAHTVVILLQDVSNTSSGRLVKTSALQRMLSQRLAKFYAYKIWGFPEAEMNAEMDLGVIKFEKALDLLTNAPENTPQILDKLDDAHMQWDLYRHVIERKDKQIPLIMARTSEELLIIMDELTGLYTALPAK